MPIITGHSDKEAQVTELQNYVTAMKERYPEDADHPPVADCWDLNDFVGSWTVWHCNSRAR